MPEEILDFATHKERWGQILVAKKVQFEAELAALDGVKGKDASKKRSSLKKQAATVDKQLCELETGTNRTGRYSELLDLIRLESGGVARTTPLDPGRPDPAGLFTVDVIQHHHVLPTNTTGPTEVSYRMQHGLSVELVGAQKGRDLPEHGDAEIKWIVAVQKRKPTNERAWGYEVLDYSKFRAGQLSSDLMKKVIWEMMWELVALGLKEGDVQKYNTIEMRDIINGTLSDDQRVKLPASIAELLTSRIRPSIALADCPYIVLTIYEGWLTVPKEDFDEAFDLYNVSKGLVSFIMKVGYVRARRERFLAAASANASEPAFIAAQ